MICLHPKYLSNLDIIVGCGKCRACRIMNMEQWSLRAYHEFVTRKVGLFCTATYSDDYCPLPSSFNGDDFRAFMKRLRKRVSPLRIKYFCAGELGTQTFRPHYHFALYSLDVSYTKLIRDCWGKGFCDVKPIVGSGCFRYIAKYIIKSTKEIEELKAKGLPLPFRMFSNGLGYDWCMAHKEQLLNDLCIRRNGFKIPLPISYYRWLNYTSGRKSDYLSPDRNKLRNKLALIKDLNGVSDDVLDSSYFKECGRNLTVYSLGVSRARAVQKISRFEDN